jgi:hypothetical protein
VAREALNPSCPQCGGPVEVPEGAAYARCKYCSAESFVDLSGALLHQVIKASVSRSRVSGLVKARAREAGWRDAIVTSLKLSYEPVWEIESPDGGRLCVSARPGQEGRFAQVRLPGGERAFVEPGARDSSADWIEPEVAPESVAEVAARATGRPIAVKTIRLVHRPIYTGQARVNGAAQHFELDALSGELSDVDWPVEATHKRRNAAWLATAVMVAAAALLPLPVAALATVIVGSLAARLISRQGAATSVRS